MDKLGELLTIQGFGAGLFFLISVLTEPALHHQAAATMAAPRVSATTSAKLEVRNGTKD